MKPLSTCKTFAKNLGPDQGGVHWANSRHPLTIYSTANAGSSETYCKWGGQPRRNVADGGLIATDQQESRLIQCAKAILARCANSDDLNWPERAWPWVLNTYQQVTALRLNLATRFASRCDLSAITEKKTKLYEKRK